MAITKEQFEIRLSRRGMGTTSPPRSRLQEARADLESAVREMRIDVEEARRIYLEEEAKERVNVNRYNPGSFHTGDMMDPYTYALGTQPVIQVVAKDFNPNEQPALCMGLTELRVMWSARHTAPWVKKSSFQVVLSSENNTDSFWFYALTRLDKAGMLEELNGWVRLKETPGAA